MSYPCPNPKIPAPVLSTEFFRRGYEMCKRLGLDWIHLLMVMNFEGAGINPGACNNAGAFGLIQFFGQSTLRNMGFQGSVDEFLHLTAEEQLPYVERYLAPYARQGLDSAARIHQALFVPATLGEAKAPDDVLVRAGGMRWNGLEKEYYSQNAGFDKEGKGFITLRDLERAEVSAAQSSRFTQILAWLKAAVPELASRVPDKISPQYPPPSSTPTPASKPFPWGLVLGLLAVGGAGTVILARKNSRFGYPKLLTSIRRLG